MGPDRERQRQLYHAIGSEPDNTEVHKKLAELEEGLITLRENLDFMQVITFVVVAVILFIEVGNLLFW